VRMNKVPSAMYRLRKIVQPGAWLTSSVSGIS
jgi:hypothetical protein